jgi:hypothetical protein
MRTGRPEWSPTPAKVTADFNVFCTQVYLVIPLVRSAARPMRDRADCSDRLDRSVTQLQQFTFCNGLCHRANH